MIKVMIVDDESIIKNGIKLILEQDSDIEVVTMASNGSEAVKEIQKNDIDLVLMDLMMPICNGIEGTKLIKKLKKPIKVLILTTFYDKKNILSALNEGADGYILKDIEPQELISTIKSTVSGLRVVDKKVFEMVLENVNNNIGDNNKEEKINALNILNENEIKIIKLIVQGNTNKKISLQMHLSEGRVRNIITEILGKLNLRDRTQLAVYTVKNNII